MCLGIETGTPDVPDCTGYYYSHVSSTNNTYIYIYIYTHPYHGKSIPFQGDFNLSPKSVGIPSRTTRYRFTKALLGSYHFNKPASSFDFRIPPEDWSHKVSTMKTCVTERDYSSKLKWTDSCFTVILRQRQTKLHLFMSSKNLINLQWVIQWVYNDLKSTIGSWIRFQLYHSIC